MPIQVVNISVCVLVVLTGNNVVVPSGSNVNFTILANIRGDAPIGVYGFGLSLFY